MLSNVTVLMQYVLLRHGCLRKPRTLLFLFLVSIFSGTIAHLLPVVEYVIFKHTITCTQLEQCEEHDMESLWLNLRPHSQLRSISSIILCVAYHSTANGQPENEVLCNDNSI